MVPEGVWTVQDRCLGTDQADVGECGTRVVGPGQKESVQRHLRAIDMRSSVRNIKGKGKAVGVLCRSVGGIRTDVHSKSDHMRGK